MRRILFALVALAFFSPSVRAAPLRTTFGFAFRENAPAGTKFWCVFPNARDQWVVLMYQRLPRRGFWPGRYRYAPLIGVTKAAGAEGAAYYQTFTVPAHSGDYCLLTAFRNGVQQPYRGWTQVPPFGWHTFGVFQAVQAIVAEYPPRAKAADIRPFERIVRRHRALAPP